MSLEEIVATAFGSGDPDIADKPLRLHGEQRLEMRLPADQVVDLHEVEARDTPQAARLLDLPHAAGGRGGPDFFG